MIRVIPTVSALEARVVSSLQKQVASVPHAEISLAAMIERAINVARQMRYFALVTQRAPFAELVPSANRAGFNLIREDTLNKEALFQWAEDEPDFIFSVSFKNSNIPSVVAESLGDISGLVLTNSSLGSTVSVETDLCLSEKELGPYALRFRNVLLMLPDFDDTPAWMKIA